MMARPVRGGGGRALAGLWCVCALLAAPSADGRAPLQHARAPTGGAPECAQRLRGGGTASSAFGLDARELAELGQLRAALGADLAAAVVRNPDFATDDRLVRLLRANQNDVGRTVRFWPAMQRLRAEFGCDEIRAEVARHYCENFWEMKCLPCREIIRKYYLFVPNHVVTTEGHLVSAECTGDIQIRSFMHEVSDSELIRFWCYLMEWNMMKLAQLSRTHRRIVSMVQIKDLQGIRLAQATCPQGLARFGKINRFVHQVYPETLQRLVVLNIPSMFGILWNTFKPLLPARTIKRISITRRNSREQQEVLACYLSPLDRILLDQGVACYK